MLTRLPRTPRTIDYSADVAGQWCHAVQKTGAREIYSQVAWDLVVDPRQELTEQRK